MNNHQRHGILAQGSFATAAELIAANEAGELTHCSAGWGARDYDSSWASTSRLSTEAAAAAAAATAAAHLPEDDLEGGAAGVCQYGHCGFWQSPAAACVPPPGLVVHRVHSGQQAAR